MLPRTVRWGTARPPEGRSRRPDGGPEDVPSVVDDAAGDRSVPASTRSNPAMSRSSVVLPLPEAPSTAVICPGGTSRSSPSSTGVPEALVTPEERWRWTGARSAIRSNHRASSAPGTTASATSPARRAPPAPYAMFCWKAQNWVANVCVPIGASTSVAVSSVTASRKTRQNPARSPGTSSGSVTRANTVDGAATQRAPDVGQLRRKLRHRRLDADQGQREVQERVGDDQQRRRSDRARRRSGWRRTPGERDDHPGQRLGHVGAALEHVGGRGARRKLHSATGSASRRRCGAPIALYRTVVQWPSQVAAREASRARSGPSSRRSSRSGRRLRGRRARRGQQDRDATAAQPALGHRAAGGPATACAGAPPPEQHEQPEDDERDDKRPCRPGVELELGEDLGGERLVAQDLECPELRDHGQHDEQAATEDRHPQQRQRHAKERRDPPDPEAPARSPPSRGRCGAAPRRPAGRRGGRCRASSRASRRQRRSATGANECHA